MLSDSDKTLRRELRYNEAISLVIGTIIGTGIFLKTTTMAQEVGSAGAVLLAWAVAGLLSLGGALVYAELGELFPYAGGEYVYLRNGYGDVLGFLYGWQRFWIGSPGSIAAYAVASAAFLSGVVPLTSGERIAAAVVLIALFTAINCLAVRVGGRTQTFLTGLKIVLVLGLSVAIFSFASGGTWGHFHEHAAGASGGWSAFGMAVLAALWAFDGWNNLPMAAGEVDNPSRTIPVALILGVIACFAVYALANVAYFFALPLSEIVRANSTIHPNALPVATLAAETVFGHAGVGLLAIAMMISALGAMNGSLLTGPRVPYAMAKDGLFPRALAKVSESTHVPVTAVLVQATWASVLAISGTFDQLTDWVVFAAWIFYALCAFSVLLFRKRMPKADRRYRVPFYPALPIGFCALALLLLGNTIANSPRESVLGLIFILSGLPVFWWRRQKMRSR